MNVPNSSPGDKRYERICVPPSHLQLRAIKCPAGGHRTRLCVPLFGLSDANRQRLWLSSPVPASAFVLRAVRASTFASQIAAIVCISTFVRGAERRCTITWHRRRNIVAIPAGAFADSKFYPPQFSVYESRQHPWVSISCDAESFGIKKKISHRGHRDHRVSERMRGKNR